MFAPTRCLRRASPLLRPALSTLLPRPTSAATSTSGATRSILHLPVLAAGVGKIIASAGLKKIAVNSVVRKLGAKRVLVDLRGASAALRQRSPHLYSAESFEAVTVGLETLERSLQGVQEHEQVRRVWRWFETLEKSYPNLYTVVFKAYAETWTPVKWASALMRDAGASAPVGEREVTPASPPPPRTSDGREESPEAREQHELLHKLHRAAPELNRYHVLLIPKDVGVGVGDVVSMNREVGLDRPVGGPSR